MDALRTMASSLHGFSSLGLSRGCPQEFIQVDGDGRSESRLRDPEPLPFEPLPVTTLPAFIPDAGDSEGHPPVDDDGALEGGGGGAFVVFGFGTGTIESSPLVGPRVHDGWSSKGAFVVF